MPLSANWGQGAFNFTNVNSWFLGYFNGTKVADADLGDVITSSGSWSVDCSDIAGSGLSCSGEDLIHNDTSSQEDSDNSGRTYIQDILLDTYGHITSIVTATETEVKLTQEEVEDIVGGMLDGTETLIDVSYDDDG